MDLESVAEQPVGYGPVEIGGGFQGYPGRQIPFLMEGGQSLKVLPLVSYPDSLEPARRPPYQNVVSSLGDVYRTRR